MSHLIRTEILRAPTCWGAVVVSVKTLSMALESLGTENRSIETAEAELLELDGPIQHRKPLQTCTYSLVTSFELY